MNSAIVKMIYGEDADILFNGRMYVLFEGEDDNRYGLIHNYTGKIITDMRMRSVIPMTNGKSIEAYILIDEALHHKMYESFYKVTYINKTTIKSISKIKIISKTPIYTNVAIINLECQIVIGKCLISPCTVLHPSMNLKYNKKSYIGKFSASNHLLESLSMAT